MKQLLLQDYINLYRQFFAQGLHFEIYLYIININLSSIICSKKLNNTNNLGTHHIIPLIFEVPVCRSDYGAK